MVQDVDDTVYFGTVFWDEAIGPNQIRTGVDAQTYLEANTEHLRDRLKVPVDDGVFPGWSSNPVVEQTMIQREMEAAGWNLN